jgi:hypothetical protein
MADSTALTNPVLDAVLADVYATLTGFAGREDFLVVIEQAFGDGYDGAALEGIRQQWLSGDFSALPQVEILSGETLQGANGAYATANNTIYFSSDFLQAYSDSPAAIVSVWLEEIGHSVDAQINELDTLGDEGAIFSSLVLENNFMTDLDTIQLLKLEADQKAVTTENGDLIVERSANTTTYTNKLIDFGHFTFDATTSEYLNKVFGIDIPNSYSYDSENKFKYIYYFSDLSDGANIDLGPVDGRVGFELGGGSVGAGVEIQAGYNLGELSLDLPLYASLDAFVENSQLIFEFDPNFLDTQFNYIAPFAYTYLDAVLDYDIGALKATLDGSVNYLVDTADFNKSPIQI